MRERERERGGCRNRKGGLTYKIWGFIKLTGCRGWQQDTPEPLKKKIITSGSKVVAKQCASGMPCVYTYCLSIAGNSKFLTMSWHTLVRWNGKQEVHPLTLSWNTPWTPHCHFALVFTFFSYKSEEFQFQREGFKCTTMQAHGTSCQNMEPKTSGYNCTFT